MQENQVNPLERIAIDRKGFRIVKALFSKSHFKIPITSGEKKKFSKVHIWRRTAKVLTRLKKMMRNLLYVVSKSCLLSLSNEALEETESSSKTFFSPHEILNELYWRNFALKKEKKNNCQFRGPSLNKDCLHKILILEMVPKLSDFSHLGRVFSVVIAVSALPLRLKPTECMTKQWRRLKLSLIIIKQTPTEYKKAFSQVSLCLYAHLLYSKKAS